MKKFLKMMLAVICGVLVLRILSILIIAGIASASSGSAKLPAQGILKIDLSKIQIAEQSNAQLNMSKEQMETIGMLQAVRAIDYAATDPGVKCIYLKTDGAAMGAATMQEFRSSLASFRNSGKCIVSYTETPTTGSYYLASVADKVLMTKNQGGTPRVSGISSRLVFLGDVLKTLGVNVQLIRHGKYKSAGEMYIRGNASPENLEQTQVMVDAMWASIASEIAASRGISVDEFNASINDLRLCLPSDFIDAGLADELVDRDSLEKKLAILAQVEDFKDVKMIPFVEYAKAKVTADTKVGKKIAIIYASGEIVDGLDLNKVDGDRYASIIEEVRKDTTVKAVVLRVNSPGGSVMASEKIRTELDRLGENCPIIASYGDYAASGGYWISCGANKIYTNPATLTGSIGVFGMIPEFSGVADNLGVGVSMVSSNAHGDMYSSMRPFTEEETAFIQRSIEAIYNRFLGLVSDGRDMDVAMVDSVAQGRVWSGTDALAIGLVDEIGTLQDAIRYAAIEGGDATLSNWSIVEYPKEHTILESITAAFESATEDYSVYLRWYDNWKKGNCEYTFAALPYNVDIIL